MLQVKNLVKIYKPQKGVPVTALAGINLTLPETGMVFLLGKSGSGKSTLLNILGGLDRYNAGDILVMGKSTQSWRQSHFDSYRNTYVGFIFQEYNILNEFSVGANIGLALQLQGQKATSERINQILGQVDLEGYGTRNPNELSGGQKQRVAIARALVKNPKIIMADEPTGALDSNTGRQVLTTLKKLSRDKLVIVVSHDREFAEQYADRIVELADGRIIRDVERLQSGEVANAVPVYMEDSVSLPEEYVLTQADKDAICAYIQKMIGVGKQPKFSLFSNQSAAFQPTDESRIPTSREGYKLIKSRLPMKYAFKLGASGLKHKKFRLVMTILLSCIALGMFGLTDTFASYSYVKTATNSLADQDNQITYAAFEKHVESDYQWGSQYLTEDEVEKIKDATGLAVYPVYPVAESYVMGGYSTYYMDSFAGCIALDQQVLDTMDAELVEGNLPVKADEAVISTHILETYMEIGYMDPDAEEYDPQKIHSAEDMLGKEIRCGSQSFTVCGVVDTGMDYSRYETLKTYQYSEDMSFTDMILIMALQSELDYARRYSLDGLLMVSEAYIETAGINAAYSELSESATLRIGDGDEWNGSFSTMPENAQVNWLGGQPRTALASDEIVLSVSQYNMMAEYMMYNDTQYDYYNQRDNYGNYSKIRNMEINLRIFYDPYYGTFDFSEAVGDHTFKLVGITEDGDRSYLPETLFEGKIPATILQTLSPMPESTQQIRKLVEFSARDFDPGEKSVLSYNLMNPVSFELKNLDAVFEVMSQVFFWIGIVFVVFSSLLFSSFIGTSISYKKEQIGILRAIGSRGADVFRIFFAESFIIAMINFVLSFGGTIAVCAAINLLLKRSTGLMLTILNVGVRQALLLLGVCLLSAFVATYIPTRKIAAKRPIDAIRDR